jgi:hypothetical protein
MSVFAVPRSTAIAFAGKKDPGLKSGQRIDCVGGTWVHRVNEHVR